MSSTATAMTPSSARQSVYSAVSSTSKVLPSPLTAFSTPATKPAPVVRPSPGTFKHPRLAEIIARKKKSEFSQASLPTVAINILALIATFALQNVVFSMCASTASSSYYNTDTSYRTVPLLSSTFLSTQAATDTTALLVWLSRLLFAMNLLTSLRPAIPYLSTPDNIEDIPLTPSQRSLLGLPPSKTSTPTGSPLATGSAYITPPRYQRRPSSTASSPSNSTFDLTQQSYNKTPRSNASADRRSISAQYTPSPSRSDLLSPSPTAPQTAGPAASTFSRFESPNAPYGSGSPLFHKAIARQRRRGSLGETGDGDGFGPRLGVGRSNSVKDRERGVGAGGLGNAKGVNYKWLYDKGYSFGNGPGEGFAGSTTASGSARGLASSQSMHF
jgi:nucleoporin POM34